MDMYILCWWTWSESIECIQIGRQQHRRRRWRWQQKVYWPHAMCTTGPTFSWRTPTNTTPTTFVRVAVAGMGRADMFYVCRITFTSTDRRWEARVLAAAADTRTHKKMRAMRYPQAARLVDVWRDVERERRACKCVLKPCGVFANGNKHAPPLGCPGARMQHTTIYTYKCRRNIAAQVYCCTYVIWYSHAHCACRHSKRCACSW